MVYEPFAVREAPAREAQVTARVQDAHDFAESVDGTFGAQCA